MDTNWIFEVSFSIFVQLIDRSLKNFYARVQNNSYSFRTRLKFILQQNDPIPIELLYYIGIKIKRLKIA